MQRIPSFAVALTAVGLIAAGILVLAGRLFQELMMAHGETQTAAVGMWNQTVVSVFVVACFVLFALISAMVIPRRRPDFPGIALGVYLAVAVAFFAGMIAAVSIFGKEKKTEKHRSALSRTL